MHKNNRIPPNTAQMYVIRLIQSREFILVAAFSTCVYSDNCFSDPSHFPHLFNVSIFASFPLFLFEIFTFCRGITELTLHSKHPSSSSLLLVLAFVLFFRLLLLHPPNRLRYHDSISSLIVSQSGDLSNILLSFRHSDSLSPCLFVCLSFPPAVRYSDAFCACAELESTIVRVEEAGLSVLI